MNQGGLVMNWNDQQTTKKGNVGEEIVRKYLKDMGFIPYSPTCDGSHPFDNLCASKDKQTIFIAEVKSKPARTYYPDTGVDIRHFNTYKDISEKHNLDVFIFFVDEDRCEVYGNWLSELEKKRIIKIDDFNNTKEYPWEQGYIHYWPLAAMIHIGDLGESELLRH